MTAHGAPVNTVSWCIYVGGMLLATIAAVLGLAALSLSLAAITLLSATVLRARIHRT